MGLFGGKKTYVASTLYNLAGDELERPEYLKSLVIGNIINNSRFSITDTLQSGYLKGPGLKMRSFFNWAVDNYDAIGVPTGSLGGLNNVDYAVVAGEIPADPGETVKVQLVQIGIGEYSFWAEQWMMENHQDLFDTAWTSDINEDTNEITITFADTTTDTFTPVDLDTSKPYLYAVYSLEAGSFSDPAVPGSLTDITPPTDPFPDTTGWTLVSDDTVLDPDLVTGPNEKETWVYKKTEYMGADPTPGTDRNYSVKSTMTLIEIRDPVPTVIERKYQIDTQNLYSQSWSETKMFIYQIGSGNIVLDNLVLEETNEGEYLPFIPIRIDNKFLSETYEPDAYELAKKAYRKTGAGNLDKIIDKIEDNEDLEDIDYAYIVYGVSLNVLENTAREYLYRYFHKLMESQTSNGLDYAIYQAALSGYTDAIDDWNAWKAAQEDPGDPLYGTPEPAIPTQPSAPETTITIKSNGSYGINLNMQIAWQLIEETTGTGLAKPDAKKGEIWLTVEANPPGQPKKIYVNKQLINADGYDNTTFSITWQIDNGSWKKLTVIGAVHKNNIYNNKSVFITGKEALEDDEESGFLVPVHMATLREMRLVDSTQMATACTFIVFNSYKVVKQKWYQTGIFKILAFVVIIAISVALPGSGAALGGLLGANAAVGAALGLSGLMGAIIGAIANAIAAMIVMRILSTVSTLVLGDKLGALFAAVLSVVVMQIGTGLMNGASMSAIWGNMMSAQNLMGLTNAIGGGVSAYIGASVAEIQAKIIKMNEDYNKESKAISQRYAEEFGYGKAVINPMSLTDSTVGNMGITGGNDGHSESSAEFLIRTLLTGSDIAEMSMSMLTNFVELTTSTDLVFDG